MLQTTLAGQVLTIGCDYRSPKGGVAQVLYNYEQYVFSNFNVITNSGDGNKLYKLNRAIAGIIKLIFTLLTDRHIKIVHIHSASYNSFWRSMWYVKVSKLLGRKVILHIHGGGFRKFYASAPQRIKPTLDSCDAIITLSQSWKEFFSTVTTCPHIAIVENIVSRPTANIERPNDGLLHLLFMGLIGEAKGIFDLIEAIHQHDNELRGKMMLHVGGKGKTDQLRALIAKYKLEDMVRFEGWVSGDKKVKLLSSSHAYILPSYTEGLPVSILEAMSYRMPILSTPVGGIPEVVTSDENGILFTPGDCEAMIAAIRTLIDKNNLISEMGNKSYDIIQPYFPDNVGLKLEHIYTSLLQ